MAEKDQKPEQTVSEGSDALSENPKPDETRPKEIGGRKGPEPTRYGDWEKNGIISDF